MLLLSGFSAMNLLLTDIFDKYKVFPNVEYDIIFLGKVTPSNIVASTFSILTVVVYFFTKNWMLSNIIAFSILFLMFKIVRIPSYKIAFILLSLAFIYDIYWVFYS